MKLSVHDIPTQPSLRQERVPKRLAALRSMATGLGLLAACAAWASPTVTYVAHNDADTTVGQDLWHYDYTVTADAGTAVAAFGGLTLLFSPSLYAGLLSSSSDADLSLLDTQPALTPPVGPADGFVEATFTNGLAAGASTTLSVSFVWLGTGAPGRQTFQITRPDFSVAFTGTTAAPGAANTVPEPSGLSLTLAALLAMSAVRRAGKQG